MAFLAENKGLAVGTLCVGGMMSTACLAQQASINITSRTADAAPMIILRSRYDFEQSISLKVRTDPELPPSDVLIRTVSNIGMTDARGIRITSGFDIDLENDLVVAFSGGTSEIIRTYQTPNGLQIITSFKDSNGNFVSPPADSLAVYTIGGKKLCFDYKEITRAAPKMAFTLLLDRSGSMPSVISDVQQSANEFLKGLPPTAECAVASFNSGYDYHNDVYQNCNAGNFKLDSLTAEGGTDLYHPLLSAYNSLNQAYFSDHQKAVIVIADGQIGSDDALRQQVEAAKNDALTFVYSLRLREDRYLTGLADAFLHSTSDISQNVTRYFHSHSPRRKYRHSISVSKGMMNAMFLKDLADKTRRGLRGKVENGKSGGGLAYGYQVVKQFNAQGKAIRGDRAIDEDQAEIVRRMFHEYAHENRSPKAIASGLNKDGIPCPSGKAWGQSTINGNRKRGTGILNNHLYIGELIWNRQRFIKDPATGRRVPRFNPESEWIRQNAADLRIVPQSLWEAAKARQRELDKRTGHLGTRKRPQYLLSGLLVCGACGGGFSKINSGRYGSSSARNKGESVCTNKKTIKRSLLEGKVLNALQSHLMRDDLVQVFCEEYARHMNALRAAQNAALASQKAEAA